VSEFDKLVEILKQYGPAIAVLIVGYFKAKAIEAKNKQRVAELEKKLRQNKEDVESENAGLSNADIIAKYIGKKPGP